MLEFDRAGGELCVKVSGEWTFGTLRSHSRELRARLAELRRSSATEIARWDLTALSSLDDAGAIWIAREASGAAGIEVPPRFQDLIGHSLGDEEAKALAAAAAKDVCLRTNACRMSEKDIEDLLQRIG